MPTLSGDIGEAGGSAPVLNIPHLTVTDTSGPDQTTTLTAHELEQLHGTRSTPCSPRRKRRAFTTWVGGTQFIIGESRE